MRAPDRRPRGAHRDHVAIQRSRGAEVLDRRLIEVYCLVEGIEFRTLGSWTLKERGAEPDECYIFGEADADRPHLAIEVIWSSGGLDTLEIYRKLGVQEAWIWQKKTLTPYALRGGVPIRLDRSEVLPDIDLPQLLSFLDRPTTSRAMRDCRAALEERAT